MPTTDSVSETSTPNERYLAVEQFIKSAADHYKQGDFLTVISLLNADSDEASVFAEKYEIQIMHPHIPIFIDNIKDIENSKYLPAVITQVLLHGHAPDSYRIESPEDLSVHGNEKRVQDIELPKLWRKVQALCLLEEWSHLLINTDDEANGIDKLDPSYDNTRDETEVALYLHNKLGIKLPKYFVEEYDRKKLGLPIEDHDFDSI